MFSINSKKDISYYFLRDFQNEEYNKIPQAPSMSNKRKPANFGFGKNISVKEKENEVNESEINLEKKSTNLFTLPKKIDVNEGKNKVKANEQSMSEVSEFKQNDDFTNDVIV